VLFRGQNIGRGLGDSKEGERRMNDPHAYTFPNSHYADMGALSPLVPDRVCELSVECCQLRNILSDKEDENDQLKSTVNRMKTAVKRGSGTLKFTVQQNKMLENEKTKLVTELMTVQKKLMQAESKVSFQSKVIENNRRMITKLKTPSDDGGHHGKNIAQILNEDAELRKKVEELSRDLEAARVEDEDKQVCFICISFSFLQNLLPLILLCLGRDG
jgi:hypothetical protein